MTIDAVWTRNIVSMDLATLAPVARKTPSHENMTPSVERDAKREEVHAGDERLEKKNVANAPWEFSMERIVLCRERINVKYVVRWYDYTQQTTRWNLQPTFPSI